MTAGPDDGAAAPYWSFAGLAEGARLSAALLPGTMVFSAAYGTLAGQKGLTLAEAVFMSGIVFAGASQLVALEVWSEPITLGTALSLAVVTGIVNARFILMGATLRPWFSPRPAWQAYATLQVTTDATWLVGMRYRADGGGDMSVYLGAGLALWALWTIGTIPGYLAGTFIADPKRFGFDLMLPIFFVAMFVPLWRGPRRAAGWAIAGAVALVTAQLIPGWWFIVVGALAGSIIGGFIDDE